MTEKNWKEKSQEMVNAVVDGSVPPAEWGAYETACLIEYVGANPESEVAKRFTSSPIQGKVYVEKFGGGRAHPANYQYPVVGSTATLDGKELP